jgi:death on curing protein
VRYLTEGQILLIHSLIVDETGGRHGVRDRHALASLAALPRQKVFGKELYPGVFAKAAVYVRGVVHNHPFIDGNKRTGMTAAFVFLEDNGYRIVARKGEIERFALKAIRERLDVPAIADWLAQHSTKGTRAKN